MLKKNFCHSYPNFDIWRHFVAKITHFGHFWSIWTDIWPFDPVNFVCTQRKYTWDDSIVRLDNVEKILCRISPQFRLMTSFCGQKNVFLTVFGQFEQIFGPMTLLTLFLLTKSIYRGDSVVRADNFEITFLSHLTPISTYDVILWLKWCHFDRFRTIWTNIWHFGPFNLVFTNKRDDEMRWLSSRSRLC